MLTKGAFTNYVCTQGQGWVGGQKNMQFTTQKVQTRDLRGQKIPKNGNIICESSLKEYQLVQRKRQKEKETF